jgi:hypothetical protein
MYVYKHCKIRRQKCDQERSLEGPELQGLYNRNTAHA